MPPVPSWAYPTVFDLTNPYNGMLSFNEQTASGIYLLIQDGCSFSQTVRSTKDDIPQADGSILHTRFLTGMEVTLTVELWESLNDIACSGDLLVEMLDNLSGAVRSLLNAGDNEGRLAWNIEGGNDRMLDDVRLLVYPTFTTGPPPTVVFTIDSRYPYAEDLTQTRTGISDGATVTLTNNGTADFSPVFQINRLNGVTGGSPVSDFVLQNLTTGLEMVWDSGQPGANAIPGGHYAELDCFGNTFYLDGNQANQDAGISQLESEYFVLVPGDNDITIAGATTDVLWQAAWA